MGIDLGRFRSKKNDEWVDWLADDPVPASIRHKMRTKAVEEASRPVVRRVGQEHSNTEQTAQKQPANGKEAAVSINISIPKIKLAKPRVKIPEQILTHKKWAIGGLAGVVLIAGVLTTVIITQGDDSEKETPAVLSDSDQKAAFAYSLPKGDATSLDGAVRYDSTRKVVNFKDSIGGIEITVSQQPLPEGFKDDTESKVKKMAEEFSATKTIATANPTAYIGTSAKGPQTVIFSKKDLLVFIQSTKEIDDHDWAEYVTNLQ